MLDEEEIEDEMHTVDTVCRIVIIIFCCVVVGFVVFGG